MALRTASEGPTPDWHVALVGNPNCGKTALFNLLTGSAGFGLNLWTLIALIFTTEIGGTLCLGDELTPGICRHPTGRFCVIMPMRVTN